MKPNILLVALVAAAVTTSSAQTPAAKAALSNTDLRKLFADTEWVTGKGDTYHIVFHRGGEITGGGISGRFYTVETPDILKIYVKDPSKDRKAAFNVFRLNVAAMIAEIDAQASPGAKGGKLLKYVGPAPKKYVRPDSKK